MKNHKKVNPRISAEEAELNGVEIHTKHGIGRNCTKCGKRKDTKKVGELFLCKTCREGAGTYVRTLGYENRFVCPCGNQELVENASTCKTCGKMLCGLCGDYCTDHLGGKK
jgi:hypothetical protein